ncbi:hypothetical protein ACWKSP_09530 [Micromonosporaceae bacterium Da 78-11]
MTSSVRAGRGDDVRVADAERFGSDVEELVARSRPGDPPLRLDRIEGPDRTGTVHAVVDSTGRFVDIGLDPGWWTALGPPGVATGLVEAIESARRKASLAWLALRRHGVASAVDLVVTLPPIEGACRPAEGACRPAEGACRPAEGACRPAEGACRPVEDTARVITGPHGLLRLYAHGRRLERVEVEQCGLTADDTDRLVADARAAFPELRLVRPAPVTVKSGSRLR